MPTINFPDYVQSIMETVNRMTETGDAVLVNMEVNQRSSVQGLVSGVLQFEDEATLHFREFVNTSLNEPKVMYAYHYQNADAQLIFRYDNAAHKPALSQPEHKHVVSDIELSNVPTSVEVLDEILDSKD